tara:strand:- start:17 stop:436 length:420 start_codon:yes stop_codon:yes gene_type:complete
LNKAPKSCKCQYHNICDQQRENVQGGCGWEQLISLLVISNLKLPAGSPADYTALCRGATRAAAAVVFAGYEIIFISPPLRCGEIFHYFCAADYLRLQPFSLINKFIFRENTPISQIVCRLWDITISEKSWVPPKTNGVH